MNYTVSRPTARVLIIMLLAALAIVGGVTRRAVAQDSPTCKTIGQTCESLFNCGSWIDPCSCNYELHKCEQR